MLFGFHKALVSLRTAYRTLTLNIYYMEVNEHILVVEKTTSNFYIGLDIEPDNFPVIGLEKLSRKKIIMKYKLA